ncbi:beta strand repeat-containing protein [Lactiplantibacillus plantarum]|uniref:Lysozyme n=1 Tax=Lactiplantibacillus plantarum TaxID=1590 RepID=A0A1E3KTS1_LACPN|nr:MucBP domain-containing protein [Lactiplantibacillus plantarum]APD01681.1 LPXTG cell wall anchor domain-containing protein [Lactiplantibacillus plantarum]KZT90988.1 Aggregation promoting factor [Lactiplantibacillus plantarum]MDN7016928.1 LPXTG cell wall anchor domain-containing protein [Lactiplantibacillus plantarum]MDN7050931.1 LPXTG cell wall anchor domain-containing protein [Lactiplantibacillus plantarum]MDN7053935.1 LPXTG cell wall anchor domain-containing protein [Lactiplantibacillus p
MSKDNQKMTGDSVYRVKMYKDGKRWVYAGATTLALAAGLVFANVNASADTAASSDATTEQVSSAASSAATSSTATSSAATDASSASSTATSTSSTASSTATTSSSAASSTASSAATSTTSAASSSAATVSATTPASSDATSTSTATVAATAAKASVATPASAAATATTTATTTAATTAPTVTAPASEAANQTAAGSVDAGTVSSAVNTSKPDNVQDNTAFTPTNVTGTQISLTAKHTYEVAVTLKKSEKLDWSNAIGQLTITAPTSNSNGTWTAIGYGTSAGVTQVDSTTNTVKILASDVADYDTVTALFAFTASDDATQGSLSAPLTFTGSTAVSQLSSNTNNTSGAYLPSAWTYTTETRDISVAAGTVVVHYVDENNNKIADDTIVQGDVDNTYTVNPATFSNYTLDTTKSSALTGKVAADTTDSNGNITAAGTELTLVYSQNTEASKLTVNYVDADNNTILPSKTYTEGADGTAAEVGGAYSVNAASVDGYTLTGDATQTGTFVSDGNTVTFTYTKDAAPVEQSTVTVNYVDEAGNVIKDPTTTTGDNGTAYTIDQPTIDGYTYKSASDSLTGTYDGNKTITLTYTKNAAPVEQSTITVNYVDADGKTIKTATTQTLDNGSTYKVETPTIDGYTYKSADAALTGTVDGNKTITLTYTKNAAPVEQSTITVNYVDADGKTIKAATTQTLDNGSTYKVETPTIDGYTYKSADAALTGTVDGNKTITLTYTKDSTTPVENKANLTINYVDADGNTIKASNVTEHIVGQAYTVGQPEIAGYTYDHATGDAIAGTIAYNGNTVTLVYTKNGGTTPTEQTKTITVNYVDADGNTIKSATTTTYKVGDTYTVATPSIDGYTYKSADGALSGTVADDATITLTYAKNDNGGSTTAPTTAPGTGDNGNNGGGTTTTAPTTAPGTGDNVNGGGTGTTTTAPVTTPSDDTVDNGNGSSNNGSSTTTSTAPATTVSDDEVTPTTTATTNNGTSGVVPASASLKPVVTTKTTTSDAKTLPQTDEDENGTALAVLGLSTLLMGSALYFGVSRRKHEA